MEFKTPVLTVARVDEFEELKPRYVDTTGTMKIAVYRFRGRYYAYLDYCPHQGGPACEGIVIQDVVGKVNEDGTVVKEVSQDHYNIACPWHGAVFDLETGMSKTNSRERIRGSSS